MNVNRRSDVSRSRTQMLRRIAMTITIDDNKTVSEIQEQFNAHFPYLRLEFFCFCDTNYSGYSNRKTKLGSEYLSKCRTLHNVGMLSISPQTTVTELENTLMTVFGLSVEVFRKSGKTWLKTSLTDDWTLEEQNKQGESLSTKE